VAAEQIPPKYGNLSTLLDLEQPLEEYLEQLGLDSFYDPVDAAAAGVDKLRMILMDREQILDTGISEPHCDILMDAAGYILRCQ
jgi:hypothetical protein